MLRGAVYLKQLRAYRLFPWSGVALLACVACGSSSTTGGNGGSDHAGTGAAAGTPSNGGAAGTEPGPMAGAAGKGSGGGGTSASSNGGQTSVAGGGAASGGGGAPSTGGAGSWDCLDAPPDLCYCNHSDMPTGTAACSAGFECCFATEASCECADQETCEVGLAQGAVKVKTCPPPP